LRSVPSMAATYVVTTYMYRALVRTSKRRRRDVTNS
jgi:hypothetical protein